MNKSKSWSYALKMMALVCFSFVLTLLVLLRVFQTDSFAIWYAKYTQTLIDFEIWIENYGATPLAVIIILINYTLKAVMPWFPVSCICVASAVIFKWYDALVINIVGLTILFALKFLWCRYVIGGNAEKLLHKYDFIREVVGRNQLSSGVVLFIARLMPSIPINSVSCVYGTTDMPLWRFLVISVVGFLYKAVTYIIIGRNVFDPASASFIVPFIPHVMLSGIIFLSLSSAIEGGNKKRKNRINIKKG